MRQSQTATPASERRRPHRESATTAAGLAAERVALADRDRERRTSRARSAARQLPERPVAR